MSYLNHVLEYFDLAQNYRNYQLSLIKKYLGKKILEVGPGRGEIIENFVGNNENQICLADIDKDLCNFLKDKFKNDNVRIINSDITDINEKFETILYMDVVEHIEDDKGEIKNAIKKLETNGYLINIVPAFQFLYSSFNKEVGHFRRYTKKDFIKFALDNKVEIVDLKYFDTIGFLILILNKLLKIKGDKNAKFGIALWNFLIPISRILDKIFFHSFGKSMICVYKKN